jgi:hypothetical protein
MLAISSGARSALPMGVAPEAIVECFIQVSSTCAEIFFLVTGSLSGARSVPPMGVAPEALMGCLQPIIDSNKSGLLFDHLLNYHVFIIFVIYFLTR